MRFGGMRFAESFAHMRHFFGGCHDKHEVVFLQAVVAVRNQGFAVAFHRCDVERVVGGDDFGEGAIENVHTTAHLDGKKQEFPVAHLPPLARPRANDEVIDFGGGEHFGIDHAVDAGFEEKLLIVVGGVFGVVHARHRFEGAEFFGQHAARDVAALVGRDADEEIGALDIGFLQQRDGAGRAAQREDIDARSHAVEALLLFVDEGYVVAVLEKEFG